LVLRFLTAFGRTGVLDDPRFADYTSRINNRDALNEIVAAEFTKFDRDELLAFADKHEITIGPVYTVLDQFEDPHFEARQSIVEVEGEQSDDAVLMHNIVPRFSGTPAAIRLAAPEHGAHTKDVLRELGLDEIEMRKLAEQGVI
jgi:crotonobetainyl-CoA:carnitine CoA-transferase CaiB-like acyl-CoA transferase